MASIKAGYSWQEHVVTVSVSYQVPGVRPQIAAQVDPRSILVQEMNDHVRILIF
jgi:hypothetical protein